MIPRLLLLAFVASFAAVPGFAAEPEPTPAPKSHMRKVLEERAAREAKKKAPPVAPTPAGSPQTSDAPAAAAEKEATSGKANPPSTGEKDALSAAKKDAPAESDATPPTAASKDEPEGPPSLLPPVEVRKDRITELDRQLHQQQKEIRRERKNTQQTEIDKTLNDSRVAKIFSIFGGESSEYRAGLAQERIELMEAEGDLMEAIAHAKTKEEKAELEKQLDQLKAFRRELEKSMR